MKWKNNLLFILVLNAIFFESISASNVADVNPTALPKTDNTPPPKSISVPAFTTPNNITNKVITTTATNSNTPTNMSQTNKATTENKSITVNKDLLLHETITGKNSSLSNGTPPVSEFISLNFQRIKVRDLLQLIATIENLDFIISDGVQGSMTLHLNNVSWKKALNVVLDANGLGYRRYANIWLIAPIDELTANETKELLAKQQLADIATTTTRNFHLTYASANEVAKILKGDQSTLLSTRGQLGVDVRTNSILVQDTPARLAQVATLVKQVDIPAKQVLIEARIVTINRDYEKELGVRFGVSRPPHISGNLEAATQMTNGVSPGKVPINPVANATTDAQLASRLNFNLPATQNFQNPGRIALSLLNLGGNYLDLELSALEQEGRGRVIASPRLMTSNLQPAYIRQGQEIPYQAATSSGATNIEFKNATLSLEIVPQITPNSKIVLDLKLTQNKAGRVVPLGNNNVAIPIDTEEFKSNVLLNNGETVVLGGIYSQTKTKQVQRVPLISSIPYLGALFRHNYEVDNKDELLIFITPKVVTSFDNVKDFALHGTQDKDLPKSK